MIGDPRLLTSGTFASSALPVPLLLVGGPLRRVQLVAKAVLPVLFLGLRSLVPAALLLGLVAVEFAVSHWCLVQEAPRHELCLGSRPICLPRRVPAGFCTCLRHLLLLLGPVRQVSLEVLPLRLIEPGLEHPILLLVHFHLLDVVAFQVRELLGERIDLHLRELCVIQSLLVSIELLPEIVLLFGHV